jgi:hypothetical protein
MPTIPKSSSLRRTITLAVLPVGFAASIACSSSDSNSADSLDDNLSASDPKSSWIYNGPLPNLTDVELTVSQKAHTLLVTGRLPDGFSGKLPYYVDRDDSTGRIALVYPVASGVSNRPVVNTPHDLTIYPHFVQADHFGGFPFIPFLNQSGGRVAFHGPITEDKSVDGPQWVLHRGPVSMGCSRMEGEHVVELAAILGVDMTKTYQGEYGDKPGIGPKSLSKLSVAPPFAMWKGRPVDVDYPITKVGSLPLLPTAADHAMKFPTWHANDYPRLVCRFVNGTEAKLGSKYCEQTVKTTNPDSLYAPFAEKE